ncbi:MAG: pentapeptide repeat-containing protein [Hamadaea sp.]|nr:pentapeptide repeat-containing protein [Hamadaea sp.]NUR49272.1 pentapeptide repeat-containing protein [Hamadaea sp.]NUT02780.1 pentapeptide repeat-containing protein [Hamadaea sp.]
MTTKASQPAPPNLPAEWSTGTPVLDDEEEWWQLDLTGDTFEGEAAGMEVEQSRLTRVRLGGVRLEKATFLDCALHHCDLANLTADGCGLRRVELVECRGTGMVYIGCGLRDVTLRDCRLDLTTWRATTFTKVAFVGCDLRRADFIGADLRGVLFERCDLTAAQFSNAKLEGARFIDCDLTGLGGVASLAGATVRADDLVVLTELLADALGISVER